MTQEIISKNPVLPQVCFAFAVLAGLLGMSLGIYMGIAKDHALTPVHAHANLLGWVGMFLFGLFYQAQPQAIDRIAKAQVFVSALGAIAMLVGLAGLLLTTATVYLPIAILGSLLVWLGMALFAFIVWRNRQNNP